MSAAVDAYQSAQTVFECDAHISENGTSSLEMNGLCLLGIYAAHKKAGALRRQGHRRAPALAKIEEVLRQADWEVLRDSVFRPFHALRALSRMCTRPRG